MTYRVIVAATHARARAAMAAHNLHPAEVRVVIDIEGAHRIPGGRYRPDEVLWESLPRSFPVVVEQVVRERIGA